MPYLKTCPCGWINHAFLLDEVQSACDRLNSYIAGIEPEEQKAFGEPAVTEDYERCMKCGEHWTFSRWTRAGEGPEKPQVWPILHIENYGGTE